MQDDYWTDVVVLKKGMKVKDLPMDWRCSFSSPDPGAQPEFAFKNGQFYVLDYMEWEVFERPIPWGTTISLDRTTWCYKYPTLTMSASAQKKLAEMAMNPKKYGLTGRMAQRQAKGIVWC